MQTIREQGTDVNSLRLNICSHFLIHRNILHIVLCANFCVDPVNIFVVEFDGSTVRILGLTMVTKNGVIKRTLLTEYEYQRKGGKIALNLDEGDELVFVMHTKGDGQVIIATRNGCAVRFDERNARAMGRTARGVRGISLRDGDYVTGVAIIEEGKSLLTVTEKGFGKKTPFEDFRLMLHRGGYGVTCHNITDKTGKLCGIRTVDDSEDLMMITDGGTIVRTPIADIPTYSRTAGGVIVMRLGEGQSLVNFTAVAKEEQEDIPEETENAEAVEATETPAEE